MKLRGKRSYELRDMTRTIDCAMGLTLRMQKFSALDGDRFFMTFIESYGFFSDERNRRAPNVGYLNLTFNYRYREQNYVFIGNQNL